MEALNTPTTAGPVVSKWTLSPKKKKIAILVSAFAVVGAVALALVGLGTDTTTDAARTGAGSLNGVCYDSYQAVSSVDKHFAVIKSKFGSVRTYQTTVEGRVNLIDAAAKANLQIAAGIWIRGGVPFADDLQAAVDGTKRHPGNVLAVYVGNEDLISGLGIGDVISKIQTTRAAFKAAGLGHIPIGTVQTDGSWLDADASLGANCDVVGVNIYPYFNPSVPSDSIADLTKRFNAIVAKYGGKTRLTETGHPSDGGGRANFGAAQNYWNQYQTWANSNGGPSPFYFQFHDATDKAGDEGHFGISADGFTWKFNVAPAATTPAPTPSPSRTDDDRASDNDPSSDNRRNDAGTDQLYNRAQHYNARTHVGQRHLGKRH